MLNASQVLRALLLATLIGLSACGGGSGGKLPPLGSNPSDSSSSSSSSGVVVSQPEPVQLSLNAPSTDTAQFRQLKSQLNNEAAITASELLEQSAVEHITQLSYAPSEAGNLNLIQGSDLAMTETELSVFEKQGFMLSNRHKFHTFIRGYAAIYEAHLPVYVSADAIMDTVHRSYDDILESLESGVLFQHLDSLFTQLIDKIDDRNLSEETQKDLAIYFGTAHSLLRNEIVSTPNKDAAKDIKALFDGAKKAQGLKNILLFGESRKVDFSQFRPRGHYTTFGLSNYFRAMMWLGRIDFRLLETQSDGSQIFHRRQYDAMLALHSLFDEQTLALWQKIDRTIEAFVGESDYMTLPQVGALVDDFGNLDSAQNADDQTAAQTIIDGGYGKQRIASHFIFIEASQPGGLPLNRSFALFGQRYVVDSEVFSNTVFDRLAPSANNSDIRLLPEAFDAAYAALGNNHAATLLQKDLEKWDALPNALKKMRTLVEAYEEDYWNKNLYNMWLTALRTLSPPQNFTDELEAGLPEIAATEQWGRRLLNTQLASWAQLRHDTILYAKQSYTGSQGCEFPDAYVEPYPEFFKAIRNYAIKGLELAQLAEGDADYIASSIKTYFDNLLVTAEMLEGMAENQRQGLPHTEAQLAFINDAVRVEQDFQGCFQIPIPDGWYGKLYYGDPIKAVTFDPTIADVHTAPTDQTGNTVGFVKHVATGYPRLFITTANTCTGPKAFVGMAFGYHELTTTGFQRHTDQEWSSMLEQGPIDEVSWMSDLIAQ